MRLRLLAPACVAALVLLPRVLTAQTEPRWRFGASVTAPTRILAVSTLTVADSNGSHVDVGIGISANASRAWPLRSGAVVSVHGRLTTAAVQTSSGGGKWSPGRAFIADASGRIERQTSPRTILFGGAGLSHWSGPNDTEPFTTAGPVLLFVEAGLSARPGEGPFYADFSASLTRFGPDDARDIASGYVWRFTVGVHRGR